MVAQRLRQPRRGLRRFARRRRAEELREQEDDQPFAEAEPEKGRLVAVSEDHMADRNDGRRRAGAETGGDQAGGEPAAIGKPFERMTDAGAVDGPRARAGKGCGGIEHGERAGDGIECPRAGDENAAKGDHDARAETIDEPALDRHQPSLGGDEDAEGDLDGRGTPVIFLIDRIDEQRPAILQVGDHHHADDAADELSPASRR
jgi:hypothetical protein